MNSELGFGAIARRPPARMVAGAVGACRERDCFLLPRREVCPLCGTPFCLALAFVHSTISPPSPTSGHALMWCGRRPLKHVALRGELI